MMALVLVIWRGLLLAARCAVFGFVFLIALTNTSAVEFHWFIERALSVPLNILLLGSFLAGVLLAVLVMRFMTASRDH